MRKINIADLKPGMKSAQTIYNGNGQLLLAFGTYLNENTIERLQQIEQESLLIEDTPLQSFDDIPEKALEKMCIEAAEQLNYTLNSMLKSEKLNIQGISNRVESFIDEVLKNRSILAGLCFFKNCNAYSVSHALEVTIISLLIGIKLQYDRDQLNELCMGALLHDIGIVYVDNNIINKPGPLTSQEYEQVKLHCELGFEVLQNSNKISTVSARVILEHHERWDGTGYPQRLKKDEIHEYARIVAVADMFSSLTSDRPYRQGYTFHEAVEYITTMSRHYFDPALVETFINTINTYPVGSVVILNSGNFGQVIDVNPQVPTLPTVRIICDSGFIRMKEKKEINLYKSQNIEIIRALTNNEISMLIDKTKSISQKNRTSVASSN